MENGGNLYGGGDSSNRSRGQSVGNNAANLAWDIWEFNTSSRLDWAANNSTNAEFTAPITTTVEATGSTHPDGSSAFAFLFPQQSNGPYNHHYQRHSLYAGDGSYLHPDPHLTCLKLGKRHYFEDTNPAVGNPGFSISKRGKSYCNIGGGGPDGPSSSAATVPRCQVEGCNVTLVNAKDYHRRHKVCEMHSKAPKVMVLGLEQRFCQQCSRFHAMSEFDGSKRSCRRRLAGHNERRRKNSHDTVSRNPSQDKMVAVGGFPYLTSSAGRALSLLSTKTDNSWVPPSDLSSRSSAALRELIAEHRAAILQARQFIFERDFHHHATENLGQFQPAAGPNSFITLQQQILAEQHSWDRFPDSGEHVTLDLMHAPNSAFGLLSPRGKAKEQEQECCELWNTLEGAHVV